MAVLCPLEGAVDRLCEPLEEGSDAGLSGRQTQLQGTALPTQLSQLLAKPLGFKNTNNTGNNVTIKLLTTALQPYSQKNMSYGIYCKVHSGVLIQTHN